jgi:mannose-6-phosphate isomerase-like protein (cupin superfamily)
VPSLLGTLLILFKTFRMKKLPLFLSFIAGAVTLFVVMSFTKTLPIEKYILVHEKNIAKDQPGPHDGGGKTIAYPFFEGTQDFRFAFRKRVLKPGSSIGYHLQKEDEVYYILGGNGDMQMNGENFPVTAGDAILTRPGSSHGLKPSGDKDLTLLIVYPLQ